MRLAAAALLLWCGAIGAHAQAPAPAPRVDGVVIFERGIYRADVIRRQDAPGTPTGDISVVDGMKIVSYATMVPAKLGTRFGVRFRIVGFPMGTTIELAMVTRLPKEGLRNPKTGETILRSEYVAKHQIGDVSYRDFAFDEEWELVPGVWTFEILYQGRKLAEQAFTVVKP